MWHAQRCIYYIWGVHSFHLTMNNSCPAVGQLSLSATGAASAAAASRASAVHLLVNIFISVALWADSVTLPPRHRRRVWEREGETKTEPELSAPFYKDNDKSNCLKRNWSGNKNEKNSNKWGYDKYIPSSASSLPLSSSPSYYACLCCLIEHVNESETPPRRHCCLHKIAIYNYDNKT